MSDLKENEEIKHQHIPAQPQPQMRVHSEQPKSLLLAAYLNHQQQNSGQLRLSFASVNSERHQGSEKSHNQRGRQNSDHSVSIDQSDFKVSKSKDASVSNFNNGQSIDNGSQSVASDGKPKLNRDHCNKCKGKGDLLCCDNCPRSYHSKCLSIKQPKEPNAEWYCPTCLPNVLKKKQGEEEKRRKQEEKDRQAEVRRKQKEEEDRLKIAEIERKREEKRREKEKLEEEKRLLKEKQDEEKRLEREAQAEAKRLKEEALAEEKRQKEAALAEAKAKKEAELQEQKRLREEALAEAKRKREEDLAEQKRKREETLAAQTEARKQREAALAEAKAKALQLKLDQQKSRDSMDPDGKSGIDSASKGFVQRKAEEKTEAEKAKEARNREIKNQFKVFNRFYPDLVEKNSIKYPIEDNLIKLLPVLHGADNFPTKPEGKKILVDGFTFERILYIWEFFNNFADYLEIVPFKLEELQAALTLGTDGKPVFEKPEDLEEGDEPDWEDYISNKTVAEGGFGLVNTLHLAAIECFFKEVKTSQEKNQAGASSGDNKDSDDYSDDQLVIAVVKYFEKGSGEQHHWPELVRIIFNSKRFSMSPLSQKMTTICDQKLCKVLPENYSMNLSLDEKLEILELLVDGLHDLEDFKDFLNSRIEERSAFNKQKMDIYAEIKSLDAQKNELIKENQANNMLSNSELILNQIEELKKKLDSANRVESKRISQQINDLQNEKNKVMREMQKIDEQIEKRQSKIEKLNEQANKTSIKNIVLGKDADRNEYWFYKEEPGKLFVKKFENRTTDEEMKGNEANTSKVVTWYYYDEEGQFDKLLEACNTKGIRERKLQENLRKLRDRMKLKKGRKSKEAQPVQGASVLPNGQQTITALLGQNANQNGPSNDNQIIQGKVDEVKTIEEEKNSQSSSDESDNEKTEDRHILFQNDNFTNALINAVWFGKKMPTKRQVLMENRTVTTRRGQPGAKDQPQKKASFDEKPTIASLKETLLNIESLYTDSGLALQREWDHKAARDLIVDQIQKAQTIDDLQQLLLRLDQGFSHPHVVRYKNSKEDEDMEEEEENSDEEDDSEDDDDKSKENSNEDAKEGDEGLDKNVRIFTLKFFKYWSSKELRASWRDYVFQEVSGENISALSVAVRILDRINGEFLQRQIENQLKKQQRERNQFMQHSSKPLTAAQKKADEKVVQASGTGRAATRNKNYAEENDDDNSEDDDDSQSEEESSMSAKVDRRRGPKSQVAQLKGAAASKGRGRGRRKISSDDDQQSEEEIEEDSESGGDQSMEGDDDDDDERSWEDRCYLCRKAGSLLCCDGCSHVAHLNCIGLKKKPEGDWHCEDCLQKMTQRRTTRGQTNKHIPQKQSSRRGSYR